MSLKTLVLDLPKEPVNGWYTYLHAWAYNTHQLCSEERFTETMKCIYPGNYHVVFDEIEYSLPDRPRSYPGTWPRMVFDSEEDETFFKLKYRYD